MHFALINFLKLQLGVLLLFQSLLTSKTVTVLEELLKALGSGTQTAGRVLIREINAAQREGRGRGGVMVHRCFMHQFIHHFKLHAIAIDLGHYCFVVHILKLFM